MATQNHADQRFIKGIKDNNPVILNEIYEICTTSVIKLIRQNNGTEDDASDVFQEALIVIIKKVRREEIILTCKFKTYLLSVCRFIWLKKLRIKDNHLGTLDSELGLISTIDIEEMVIKRERHNFYLNKMKELGTECQKVLRMYTEGKSMLKIAETMGYKTQVYARKRKHKCKEKFLNLIKEDVRYSEFIEE
ncbi:MAG: RNA polymerase sigma factor [Saprospiraceae bacterium]